MHRIYANLIQQGFRELENVPEPWKEETRQELERRGWKELTDD